jgi:hypothetical protein
MKGIIMAMRERLSRTAFIIKLIKTVSIISNEEFIIGI